MRAQDPDKHKELIGLLGELPDERFADLVALGKHITDYSAAAAAANGAAEDAAGDALDDDIGVAVEFEGDEDDDEDDDVDELVVRVHAPPALLLCGSASIPHMDLCPPLMQAAMHEKST